MTWGRMLGCLKSMSDGVFSVNGKCYVNFSEAPFNQILFICLKGS